MANKHAREVELKLAVPDGWMGLLAERLGSQASTTSQARRHHQVTTYFDTPDQALARTGMSLRVRDTEGQRVQTFKADSKGGVAADRAEWEWPVEQDKPDLSLLEETPVAGKLPRGLDLEPVFATDIDRTIRVLELDGGTVVEVAFDEGAVMAGESREPVREMELELRKGDVAPLYRLALELHADVPFTIGSESKAARGYRLRSGVPPAACKAEDVVLGRKTSAAEAFRQILTAELSHLLANQPAALSGDAEGVHQMRVGIRRLRAALTLFQPLLEPHTTSRFQAELRRMGRVLGEARDWDVFCLEVLPDTLQAAGVESWRDLLQNPALARREEAHRHFAEEILAPPFTALLLGLAAWAEQKSLLGNAALERSIEDVCPRLLDRLARKVERRGRHIECCSDAERHALRKSLKKLRYGIDYVLAVFPEKAIKSYLHACRKLQKTLGDINDAVTAAALVDQLGEGTRPDLAPAAGALTKQLNQRRKDGSGELSKRWKAFRAEPRFWE